MTNYYGTGRSNYFKVKNKLAFMEWCEKINIEFEEGDEENPGTFAIFSIDECGFPTCVYDDKLDTYIDIDIVRELQKHLEDEEICILIECGNDKQKYLSGWSIAFTNKKILKKVTLYDPINYIYKKFPDKKVSLPEY